MALEASATVELGVADDDGASLTRTPSPPKISATVAA